MFSKIVLMPIALILILAILTVGWVAFLSILLFIAVLVIAVNYLSRYTPCPFRVQGSSLYSYDVNMGLLGGYERVGITKPEQVHKHPVVQAYCIFNGVNTVRIDFMTKDKYSEIRELTVLKY